MNTENTFEAANRRYHTAHIAFAQIDAKVIDASATLEELREKHTAAASELNAAREGLVQARSPAKADTVIPAETSPASGGTGTGEIIPGIEALAQAVNGSAVDRETVDAAIEF